MQPTLYFNKLLYLIEKNAVFPCEFRLKIRVDNSCLFQSLYYRKFAETIIFMTDLGEVNCRSRQPVVFCKKGVPKKFAKYTGKHLRWRLRVTKICKIHRKTHVLQSIKKKISFQKKNKTQRMFKGYLRYKTITSQNVPSEAQIKNFLIS